MGPRSQASSPSIPCQGKTVRVPSLGGRRQGIAREVCQPCCPRTAARNRRERGSSCKNCATEAEAKSCQEYASASSAAARCRRWRDVPSEEGQERPVSYYARGHPNLLQVRSWPSGRVSFALSERARSRLPEVSAAASNASSSRVTITSRACASARRPRARWIISSYQRPCPVPCRQFCGS